jgi:beta-carotene 3-hydroxylase
MEFVAWSSHKYLMHGALWFLHQDHHSGGYTPFQKNDSFFLIFAIPSWLCIMLGLMNKNGYIVSVGVGILLYGICYFLVHDVIIHRRFRWFTKIDNRYIRAIRWAHKMHHRHLSKENGESFGMLLIARKYWNKIKNEELRKEPTH